MWEKEKMQEKNCEVNLWDKQKDTALAAYSQVISKEMLALSCTLHFDIWIGKEPT